MNWQNEIEKMAKEWVNKYLPTSGVKTKLDYQIAIIDVATTILEKLQVYIDFYYLIRQKNYLNFSEYSKKYNELAEQIEELGNGKIDEIKREIGRIYLQEYDVVPKYFAVIEQLRPYLKSESDELKIELADLVISNIAKIKMGLCNLKEFELAANLRRLEKQIKGLVK